MADSMYKTKEQNTFRFKSFGDRVNEIDLRRLALYHIGHQNETLSEEENQTHFHQTVKKWMVLNLTEEFNIFSRKCHRIVTLPQLIHQKDVVIDALLERLATATALSLQPLLEILYVLARDLREEFYQYFQRVLDRLICLLNTEDAEQLEWTFVCLAYMFKSLKPYLKRNIGVVFHSILPLLDEQRYPEHITNFAVECFSFIARDVRDYKKFLDFVLDTVAREHVQSVQGCGRLLFEIMRGIKGQFHSAAGEFLLFIFNSLIDGEPADEEKTTLLCEIIYHAEDELLKFIYPQNIGLLWEKLCEVANKITETKKIVHLLPIFLHAVSYRNGRQLAEMDIVVPVILKMTEKCIEAQEYKALHLLADIVSKIVLSTSTQVTQLDTSRLIKKMLTLDQRDIYDRFILLIVTHPQFEFLVLPGVVNYFETHFDVQSLELLARIALEKQPLARNAIGMPSWQQYPLHLKKEATLTKLIHKLSDLQFQQQHTEDLTEFILLCIVAPHLRPLDRSAIEKTIKSTLTFVLDQTASSPENFVERRLQIFSLLLETAVHLDYSLSKEFAKKCVNIILPYLGNSYALDILDLILSLNIQHLNEEKEKICKALSPLLSTHQHHIRLTASHCFQNLYKTESSNTPYDCFFGAESIQLNLHNYREHLLHLQKLETSGELYKSFCDSRYKRDVLHFLLGTLYQNFKFIWEPTLQLIEDYAKAMPLEDFWSIYRTQLENTAFGISLAYNQEKEGSKTTSPEIAVKNWSSTALNLALSKDKVVALNQQELFNYRNLLWQRLPKLSVLIEVKNRELVTLFLRFVEDEYCPVLEKRGNLLDLLKSTDKQNIQSIEEEIASESDADEDQDMGENTLKRSKNILSRHKGQRPKANSPVKNLLQTLQIKMGIFVVQPNPKALYREADIYKLYMELLAGPNPNLQKLALDCVMAYKLKPLLAHKDHLYALIDEQKFKDELVQFKLDTVILEHRNIFMEILLRILYGKMITRGTQRSLSQQVRKSLILRFLGQCNLDEVIWFLRMAVGRYSKFAETTTYMPNIPQMVQNDFDLHAVCSPKKLRSIVNLLELVRKEFGGIMNEELHEFMLKLLIFVGCTCQAVLDAAAKDNNMEHMHPKIPVAFRNVKNVALSSVVNFLMHIESFEWQAAQLACVTEVFVMPTITRLPQECIHTPTPLLKLLLQWGEQPRFYGNFTQTLEDQKTIFHYIIELLLNERAKSTIRKPIMSLIANLLNSASSEEEQQNPNIALSIVKPFIPQILQRLKMNLGHQKSMTKQRRMKVDKLDLNILSLLTTHVEDNTTCDNLLQILLPVLMLKVQSSANDEFVVSQVVTTLSNLIKRLDQPETYILKVAPLFEFVQDVNARKMLCGLVVDIASKRLKQAKNNINTPAGLCDRLKEMTRLTLMLNAWDKRWVEQPDYDKRLDAMKEISNKLENGAVDIDLGVLVIFNCCYFLRFDKDMGLRDNAGEHLRLLLPNLTKQFSNDQKTVDYLVGDIFINLARRLLRDPNDNIRNEGLHLLSAMVRHCPESHIVLGDLAPLADKHDEEVDFFINLTHLQSHRHGRALLKFCTYAESLKTTPTTRTLTEFILPLATRYLLQEKYAAKHTLVDAAIETVGVTCQLLPWQHYHTVLRYYLQKMRTSHDYQKQCVRIVVRILDAFHFDLKSAEGGINAQKVAEQLQENEKAKSIEENTDSIEENQENLEEALDDANEENLGLADDRNSEVVSSELILKKPTQLSTSASKRVLSTITCVLIPTLNRAITEKSHYDTQHKVNRKRVGFEREEEEILRVPIALALVKLMQKLPKELMDTSLPGVFMKVCTFLRSPLKSVRMLTRDILKKIITTLGSSYLPLLIEHLQSLLTRGFQVHVLSVTIHGILDALRGKFDPGDIDSCLGNLLEVALNDIFGDIAAEKEVQKIASHTPEAKPSAKSYLVLHIAARNIQESCLLDLLMPFKEHLARSHARKLVLKIQDCFAKIVTGLVENPHISLESLLVFIYGMISESITDLLPGTQKRTLTEKEKEKMRRARPDSFIIQPTPQRRMGAVNKSVKSNAQANAHILIEFGLEMFHIILKRKKLANLDYEAFLNPLLPLLRDTLKSSYVRVTTFTLKCFAAIWNNEYILPELDVYLSDIVARMFEILKNLSTFGASKQEDNLQLVKSTLKALVGLLRQCPQYTLTTEEVDQLVLHIEQDLYESEKQPVSFALLKAMLGRKVDTPSMHDILRQIAELSITSQSDYVRDECRNLLLTYVMEYSLKNRVDQIVKNFSVQLCYSVPAGRLSAIQFFAAVIKRFPQNILSRRAEFLYLSLGTRLVNDDDTTCRKAVAECIESLISRLEKADRTRLFDMTILFFEESQKPSVREMAACLCSRFLNVEKGAFKERLPKVFPILVGRLTLNDPRAPGKFVRAPKAPCVDVELEISQKKRSKYAQTITAENGEATVERSHRAFDHEIIQIQYCVHKILEYCLADIFEIKEEALLNNVDELAYASQRLLGHEHTWVRCNAAITLSQILAHYDFALIGSRLCCPEVKVTGIAQLLNFIYSEPASEIKSLVLDLCAQMVPGDTPQTMIDEIAKIFLYIANMLKKVPFVLKTNDDNEVEEDKTIKINIKWLVGRIRFLINKEVAKAPHCVSVRTAMFNLIEGLLAILKVETIRELSPMILLVLVREMSEEDQQVDIDLRQLALHVGSRVRKCIGSESYDKLRAHAQTALLIRRAERKKLIAQEKIHDPVRAAKRKLSMQDRKKAAKKRKNDVMRGKVQDIKHKLKKRKRKAESGDLF